MMAFIRTVIGFCFAALLIAFAIMNRHFAEVSLTPWNDTYSLPVFMIALGFMAIGFIVGGALVWLNGSSTRRTKRQQIKTLEAEVKELRKATLSLHKNEPEIRHELIPDMSVSHASRG